MSAAPQAALPETASMSFGAHLDELRGRLIISVLAVFLAAVGCWAVIEPLMLIVTAPVLDALTELGLQPQLIVLAPTEAFLAHLKLSLVAGVLLASPVICYQIWAFVGAGLYPHERRYAMTFMPVSLVMFVTGVLFFYFIVMPYGLTFLLGFGVGSGVVPQIRLNEQISFFLLLSAVMGGAFQLPLVMLFVIRLGVLTAEDLASKRRVAILCGFVLAAMLTPPDVITQVALAIPLTLLYEVGLVVSRVGMIESIDDPDAPLDENGNPVPVARIRWTGLALLLAPTALIIGVIVVMQARREPPEVRAAGRHLSDLSLARALASERPAAIAGAWRQLASSADPLVRLEALARLADTLREDEDQDDPLVRANRAAAARILADKMRRDPDPAVQVEAAFLLGEVGGATERRAARLRLLELIERPGSPLHGLLAHRRLGKLEGERALACPPTAEDLARAAADWRRQLRAKAGSR